MTNREAKRAGRIEAMARQWVAATLAAGIIASHGVSCGVDEAAEVLGELIDWMWA